MNLNKVNSSDIIKPIYKKAGLSGFFHGLKLVNITFFILCIIIPIFAQAIPRITLAVDDAQKPADVAVALQILFFITILALAPSLLIMLTSFIRLIIVFAFLRRALGTQTMPPDQVLIGLSLFLTLFIMMPVFTEINDNALQPYLAEEITWKEGLEKSW